MGSFTSIARTFQSVSPPCYQLASCSSHNSRARADTKLTSLIAKAPRILTCFTWPTYPILLSAGSITGITVRKADNSLLTNIEQIHRVVVSGFTGEVMLKVGALPRLRNRAI